MSPITSYTLWWDEGSNGEFWYSLIGINEPIIAQTSFTVTNGILQGQDYQFQIRAMNIWGWGPFSPVATIKASTVPNAVTNIVTSYDSVTGNFMISWNVPQNNGDLVSFYKIQVYSNSTSTWNEDPNCNGLNPDVALYTICEIPVLALYSAPHFLVFNQFVSVRVQAMNAIGFGSFGTNSAAVAFTLLNGVPTTMYSPSRGSQTSITQIEVDWIALTIPNNGNEPIVSYNLQWDAGTGDCSQDLIGNAVPYSALSYIVTQNIVLDRTYCFRLRALNIYGWGDFSYLSYIRTSSSPGQMDIL